MNSPRTRREFAEAVLTELENLVKWAHKEKYDTAECRDHIDADDLDDEVDAIKTRVKKLGGIDEGAE